MVPRTASPVAISGDTLKIGPLASTRMACLNDSVAAQEDNYLKALGAAERYAFEDPNTLIYCEGYDKPLPLYTLPNSQILKRVSGNLFRLALKCCRGFLPRRSAMLARRPTFILAMAVLFLPATVLLPGSRAQNTPNPWSISQTVEPGDLLKELADPKSAPTILFVGFQRLYAAGHIRGAQYHGTGGSAEGLAQLKSWAASQPRSTNLVIYCGCCPMDRCPNIRPAFAALRDLGFTRLRVLVLPTSFQVDWADKGFPYEKGP